MMHLRGRVNKLHFLAWRPLGRRRCGCGAVCFRLLALSGAPAGGCSGPLPRSRLGWWQLRPRPRRCVRHRSTRRTEGTAARQRRVHQAERPCRPPSRRHEADHLPPLFLPCTQPCDLPPPLVAVTLFSSAVGRSALLPGLKSGLSAGRCWSMARLGGAAVYLFC